MIDSNINEWQTEVLSDSRYIAIMPFLWQTTDGLTGASDMPFIKARLYELAYSFLPLPSGDTHVFPVRFAASSTYRPAEDPGINSPFAAFDLATTDMWNAGTDTSANAPWIEADFGGLTHITGVSLATNQDKAGLTTHRVDGTTDGVHYSTIATFSGSTIDNQWLHWRGAVDVVAIRVYTLASPGWVAWRDIQFCRAVSPRPPQRRTCAPA